MTGDEVIPIVQLVSGGKDKYSEREVVEDNRPVGGSKFQLQSHPISLYHSAVFFIPFSMETEGLYPSWF